MAVNHYYPLADHGLQPGVGMLELWDPVFISLNCRVFVKFKLSPVVLL